MAKDMKNLFLDELHDIFSAEHQVVKALPGMVLASHSPKLKLAFSTHLKETKGQIKRLEKIFKLLHHSPVQKFCKAAHGLIEECKEAIKDYPKSAVRDAALISKAQRFEHYEISAYGTARTFAKELGHTEVAQLLLETEKEEAHADKALTKLAVGGIFREGINIEAQHPTAPKTKPVPKRKPAPKKKTVVKKTTKRVVIKKAK